MPIAPPPVMTGPPLPGPRVALVLGARVLPGGAPSAALERRARHAAMLWRDGLVDAILACGGVNGHPPAESSLIARICRAEGVDPAAIHVEDRSTTTRENLTLAQPILARLMPRAVVIVTDPYHAPRSRLIARELGLVVSTDTPPCRAVPLRQWLRHVPREAVAIIATLAGRR